MKHHIVKIMLLAAVTLVASCGEDRQDDIDKLNALHTSIESRVSKLEPQVQTLNTQLSQLSTLAKAVEQGFYVTQVKTTADGYELTLSDGHVIVLQTTPGGMLIAAPAVSMAQTGGFYFWTVGGTVLTGEDGLPIRADAYRPVVRFDYTLNQWLISIDGGVTFSTIDKYQSIIINDKVLMQVINNYLRQHQSTIFSQQVLFQIISAYIQQHYKELFSIDILNQTVANYIREHYTRIFSYELLEKIFTQYNFSYIKENIRVEELTDVILQFIRDHKEVFTDNDVLYAIISNYIELNKTAIFTNEMLIEVISNFLENNENFIDVDLLTLVVSNYMDEHADVVFNTETVRTLLTRYTEKWYVEIISQDILVRLVSTYVTEHSETIFNRKLIEEVTENYIRNNSTAIFTHDQQVEIVNNYLKVNATTVFNREVLIDIVTAYFEKNYSLYIKREDIMTAINSYISTHQTTLISVEVVSEIVNNYLKTYYKQVFTADMLKQVIISYFRQHKEEVAIEFGQGKAPITKVVVDGGVCTVTLANGQTVQLQVYGAGSVLSKTVQSLVILPNSEGRIDEATPLQLSYLVSPASMAQVIASDPNITMELVATDGAGAISRIDVAGATAGSNGVLSLSARTGESAKAVALHVKDERNVATDIMTEFTPVGPGEQQDTHLTCPDDRHPHMIDLGLPSGTLWACCNEGAHTPADYGDYYAWGETKTKTDYSYESYIYGNLAAWHYYKNIGSNIAGTQYDVASMMSHFMRVMPTSKQLQELCDYCTSEWTTQGFKYDKPVYGLRFTGKNGASIFLPAAGWYYGLENWSKGTAGHYWSSEPSSRDYSDKSGAPCAIILSFRQGYQYVTGTSDMGFRQNGLTIRPVAMKY